MSINYKGIGLSIVFVLFSTIILAGCVKPEIIIDSGALDVNAAATDASAFISAGCIDTGDGELNCSSMGLERKFSCENIRVPNDLGGLSSKTPIVECNVRDENWTDDSAAGIVREGCLLPIYRKYIVIEDGEYKLIGSKQEFIDFFAPVESPEEALAFAVSLTNSHAGYNMTIPDSYTTFTSKIRTTYVERMDAGFKVHLFNQQFCGCGNHPYFSIDYNVMQSGEVSEISSEKIFENPELSGLCVD